MEPILESLEWRMLLSVWVSRGVLRIEGTNARDVISVRQTGKAIYVDNGGATQRFKPASIRSILANLRKGNDSLNLNGVKRGAIADGGDGNDHIIGGNGRDELHGDHGNDRLQGRGGRDSLYGGNGEDRLEGGDGNDLLDGGEDKDVMYGGEGRDRFRAIDRHKDYIFGGGGNDFAEVDKSTRSGPSDRRSSIEDWEGRDWSPPEESSNSSTFDSSTDWSSSDTSSSDSGSLFDDDDPEESDDVGSSDPGGGPDPGDGYDPGGGSDPEYEDESDGWF